MAYGVQDRLFLQIRINGEEVLIDSPNSIDVLHLVEGVRIYVPMLSLVIRDTAQFFTKRNLLVDGAEIEVTVEMDNNRRTYNFRLFSFKEDPSQGVTTYHIQAYLSAPKYWLESPSLPLSGSVSTALQRICSTTGLTYDGITTADSQLWIPNNVKYCEFARQISERAWVSPSSCCQLALTSNRVLRLTDVSKLSSSNPSQYFTNKDNSKEQQVISDFKILNKAGFYNSSSGYKQTRVVQSPISGRDRVFKDLKLAKNTAKLMMNDDIHSSLAQSKVVFSPIDFGNTTDTYEEAFYQNRRLSNLFGFGLEFVTPRFVSANLLDPINCELSKPGIDGIEAYNGKYLLTTKVLYVQGANAVYKCEAFRHGLNTHRETTQA